MNRRTQLAKGAIALAERSQDFTQRARLQSDLVEAERLHRRAFHMQRGAIRLLRYAEAHK